MNNPYFYHPNPLCISAANEVCEIIASHSKWELEFAKGKMLGVLVTKGEGILFHNKSKENKCVHHLNNNYAYIAAYSGIVGIEENEFFVPPVYDLNNPGDFYKKEEARITEINRKIVENSLSDKEIEELKAERKQRSQELQLEIFKHFDFINQKGNWKNIIGIFSEAKRGMPPGGAGECAAPRLLQYAFSHGLKPIAMAEFWYGVSPRQEIRVHRQFYPSCIEKCSPILKFMLGNQNDSNPPISLCEPKIIFEDDDLIVLDKPADVLSVPAKDTTLFNVETWLHETHPEVKGPMLVHRLDQSTSGLMIAAKNAATFKTLQQGFLWHGQDGHTKDDNKIKKTYLAWVEGHLPSECGVINLPICPNPDDRPRQVVDRQFGKTAISRYKVIKRENDLTLLALYPFTGRTHQLRLHCASPFGLDHPIVGDRIYCLSPTSHSTRKISRLYLHAAEIEFIHPKSLSDKNLLSEIQEKMLITSDQNGRFNRIFQ